MKRIARSSDRQYHSFGFHPKTPTSSQSSESVIKYIAPRVIAPALSSSFQESSRGTAWSRVGSNLPTPTTTDLGLATLIQCPIFTTIPAIHSIDGERIIDEQRDLCRITETLCEVILKCCNLEAFNRAQQLQIEWIKQHIHQNRLIIEKMFLTETESAQHLVKDHVQQKPAIEAKLTEIHRATSAHDEQYKQLLSRRNAFGQEILHFERRIAEKSADTQLLQRRVQNLDDECKFYLLKNQALHARKVRLRYELDEEIFSREAVRGEWEVLENEKITNEDIHSTSFDNIRISADLFQVTGVKSSKDYSNQLNAEVQRMRDEYGKKISVYREELHRHFELKLYRYQIQKSQSTSSVTKEHQLQLEHYCQSKADVVQQIIVVRGSISVIIMKIKAIETNSRAEKDGEQSMSSRKQQIAALNQMIQDRERKLAEALRIRKMLKQQIDNYRERLYNHDKFTITNDPCNRATIHDSNPTSASTNPYIPKPKYRSSLGDWTHRSDGSESPSIKPCGPSTIIRSSPPVQRSKGFTVNQPSEFPEPRTLSKCASFSVTQDCEELNRILNNSTIDEIDIIRILCNRNIDQRLKIRKHYKDRFHQNLSNAIEGIRNESLSKFLRLLLSSPVERDCFELRKILKRPTIDENILVEILFSRSLTHIQILRDTYQKLFNNTPEQDILTNGETHSNRLFITVFQSNRPETNNVQDDEILKDARELFETEAAWRVDGSTFVRLLCSRSINQLKQIFAAYQQFSYADIEQTIKAHIKGSLCNTLIAIIRIIRDQPRFFAYELNKSLKDSTIIEENINRIIISRTEIDMGQIKTEYEKITNRTLYDHIQANLQGNYKRAVLELIRPTSERTIRNVTFQYPEEPAEIARSRTSEQSTVQWRPSVKTFSSDTYTKRSFARSYSDQSLNERRQTNEKRTTFASSNDDFGRTYQSAGGTGSAYIDRTSIRTQLGSPHRFRVTSPTIEDRLERNDE